MCEGRAGPDKGGAAQLSSIQRGGKMEERTEPRHWGSWDTLGVVAPDDRCLEDPAYEYHRKGDSGDDLHAENRGTQAPYSGQVIHPTARHLNNSHEMFYAQASESVCITACTECQYRLLDHLLCQLCLQRAGRVAPSRRVDD